MMAERTLNYLPRWYHLGDADEAWVGLVYGTLALGTIFLIEYIFSSLLFSNTNGISISDAAAHLTFGNSSWLDIGKWLFPLTREREKKICKRAIFAIFF